MEYITKWKELPENEAIGNLNMQCTVCNELAPSQVFFENMQSFGVNLYCHHCGTNMFEEVGTDKGE